MSSRLLESKGPVLHKLLEAFEHASKVYAVGAGVTPLPPRSRFVQEYATVTGALDLLQSCALVTWEPGDSTLVLALKGSHRLFEQVLHDDRALGELVAPAYLAHLGTGARVVGPFEASWERLHAGVLSALGELLGPAEPRRILCCGYCAGGALASLAAPWAALAFPPADVRAVTFGAPRVGNSEFQRLFSWLVGLSYRAVYRFDPIPEKPRPRAALSLQLQGVGSTVFFDGRTAQRLETPLRFSYTLDDHMMDGYVSGVMAAESCAPRIPLSPWGHASLVDPAALPAAPQLDERGDCTGRRTTAGDTSSSGTGEGSRGAAAEPGTPGVAGPAAMLGGGGVEMGPAHKVVPGSPAASTDASLSAAPSTPRGAALPGLPPLMQPWRQVTPFEEQLQAAQRQLPEHEEQAEGRAGGGGRLGCGGWLCRGSPGSWGMRRALSAWHQQEAGQQGGRAEGQSPRKAAAAGSPPSTSMELHEFWGDLRQQVSQVQSMYLGLAASGQVNMEPSSLACVAGPAGAEEPGPTAAEGSGSSHAGVGADQHKATLPATASTAGAAAPVSGGSEPGGGPAMANVQDGQQGGMAGGRGSAQQEWWRSAGSLEEVIKASLAGELRWAAECAYASYLPREEFARATGLAGAVLVEDPRTDAQAYVAWQPDSEADGTAVLVFRGTANRQDAAADIKLWRRQVEFLPRFFPGCKAHLGFLRQFLGITSASDRRRNLGTALSALSGGRRPSRVVCVGHSLGGALATLGAAWAALEFPAADCRCITFGSPRVGNRKFVRAFQTLVGTRLRVVHGADPVTAVPPAFRFSHVEPAVFVKGSTLLLWRELWPRRFMFSIGDHFMTRYLASIHAALGLPEQTARESPAGSKELEALGQPEQAGAAMVAAGEPAGKGRDARGPLMASGAGAASGDGRSAEEEEADAGGPVVPAAVVWEEPRGVREAVLRHEVEGLVKSEAPLLHLLCSN